MALFIMVLAEAMPNITCFFKILADVLARDLRLDILIPLTVEFGWLDLALGPLRRVDQLIDFWNVGFKTHLDASLWIMSSLGLEIWLRLSTLEYRSIWWF